MAPSDYGNAWKDMLDGYFREFLAYFLPEAECDIDWTAPVVSLEQELRQISPDAEVGGRMVDKLVKVRRLSGSEVWVMVHVEVQGDAGPEFAERMYVYNYRVYDRYRVNVCSVGVLTDENRQWRPVRFAQGAWGSIGSIEFPIVKLIDYGDRADGLNEDSSVFALVVQSHLAASATRGSADRRLGEKLALVRRLYGLGLDARDVRALARFLDWVMTLPPDLALQFETEVQRIEEINRMPYLMEMERRALAKGREEGREDLARDMLCKLLERRFGLLTDVRRAAVMALSESQAVDMGLRTLEIQDMSELGI